MTQLKIFRTNPEVVLPTFGTEQAACFDLAFQAYGKHQYTGHNAHNSTFTRTLREGKIILMPRDRIMVPTGLIFDIPEGYSVRIHPRSGLSYKQGLILANLEAVIDSDYVHETFVLLTNISENHITINNGDRIAQAELVVQQKYTIVETTTLPGQKTDRVGGLGSTGVSSIVTLDAAIAKRGPGRPKKAS